MQVESPDDVVCAYATQVTWLERRLGKLKTAKTPETDPVYVKVVSELNGCQNALTRMKAILVDPKGHWVQVLKSKAPGLAGRVGKVTYVNLKHNFASVLFSGDEKPRNLGMGNLLVISLPVPTMKIPCVGMRVFFENDPIEYISVKWEPTKVFVEPASVAFMDPLNSDRYSKREWKSRFDIVGINGSSTL